MDEETRQAFWEVADQAHPLSIGERVALEKLGLEVAPLCVTLRLNADGSWDLDMRDVVEGDRAAVARSLREAAVMVEGLG